MRLYDACCYRMTKEYPDFIGLSGVSVMALYGMIHHSMFFIQTLNIDLGNKAEMLSI
jgi:predicted membrane protein